VTLRARLSQARFATTNADADDLVANTLLISSKLVIVSL
jgi:hypothetical protein